MEDMYGALGMNSVFYFIYDVNHQLRKSGVINHDDEVLSNLFVSETERLYDNILQEILKIATTPTPDYDFYRHLFDIKHGYLYETRIHRNDPFYPLFKLLKRCSNNVNQLKYLTIEDQPENAFTLEKVSTVSSILYDLRIFLDDLNQSICSSYTLELHGTKRRTKVRLETRANINDIIQTRTRAYQIKLRNTLGAITMQTPAYISMNNSFENLQKSFRLCGRQLSHASGSGYNDFQKQEEISMDSKLLDTRGFGQHFPVGLQPEALVRYDLNTSVSQQLVYDYPEFNYSAEIIDIKSSDVNREHVGHSTTDYVKNLMLGTSVPIVFIVVFLFLLLRKVFR